MDTKEIEKRLEIARVMLEVASYLQEEGESKLAYCRVLLYKIEDGSSDEETLLEEVTYFTLEAEEDSNLSKVLSKKAKKYIENIKLFQKS